jgi:hypothetical protein
MFRRRRHRRLEHIVMIAIGKCITLTRFNVVRFGELHKARIADLNIWKTMKNWGYESGNGSGLEAVFVATQCQEVAMSWIRILFNFVAQFSAISFAPAGVTNCIDEKRREVASEWSKWDARRHDARVFWSKSFTMIKRISLGTNIVVGRQTAGDTSIVNSVGVIRRWI